MKIILDFDNVLFDSEAFKRVLTEHSPDWFSARKLEYLDGIDLAGFLFPDTVPFLERHHKDHELVLMTAGIPEWQSAKVESSGIAPYFNEIVLSGADGKKAREIQKRSSGGYDRVVYLDDCPLELNAALNLNPAVVVVEMRRPEGVAHEGEPFAGKHTVENLESFIKLLQHI